MYVRMYVHTSSIVCMCHMRKREWSPRQNGRHEQRRDVEAYVLTIPASGRPSLQYRCSPALRLSSTTHVRNYNYFIPPDNPYSFLNKIVLFSAASTPLENKTLFFNM